MPSTHADAFSWDRPPNNFISPSLEREFALDSALQPLSILDETNSNRKCISINDLFPAVRLRYNVIVATEWPLPEKRGAGCIVRFFSCHFRSRSAHLLNSCHGALSSAVINALSLCWLSSLTGSISLILLLGLRSPLLRQLRTGQTFSARKLRQGLDIRRRSEAGSGYLTEACGRWV